MDVGVTSDKHSKANAPLPVAEIAGNVEMGAVSVGTNRVSRFRERHPLLTAFIVGNGLIGIFTTTSYQNWSFEGINLKVAVYQIVFDALGGGIAMVVLAFVS